MSTDDIARLLAHVAEETLARRIDASLCNALSGLARTALAANELATLTELASRVERIESLAAGEASA